MGTEGTPDFPALSAEYAVIDDNRKQRLASLNEDARGVLRDKRESGDTGGSFGDKSREITRSNKKEIAAATLARCPQPLEPEHIRQGDLAGQAVHMAMTDARNSNLQEVVLAAKSHCRHVNALSKAAASRASPCRQATQPDSA